MSGIAHLAKDNKTKAARIDSMDTDSVNSIIERISGVNPTKLAEGTDGKSSPPPAQNSQFGAPPSPIVQNFQQPPQQSYTGNADLQQMQQRMQMLEQKVAHYESGTAAADKLVRQGKEDQSNRSGAGDSSGGTYAPNMNTKTAAKKIMKKDVADGETDPPKAQPQGGQPMAASRTNILGISMNEWNDLIGVTTPYANPSDPQNNLFESREGEEYEEFVESYFTEDELAEAWFAFIEDKGYDAEEFADFAEAAEEYGDEAALLAIQDLEDEFQEAVDSFVEVDDGRLTQEEVDECWEIWLEDRGLSADLFHAMIDEAVATEDQDEIDNLLAVEDMFYDFLESETQVGLIKKLRGGGQLDPASIGAKPSASFLARTRKQGADKKPDKPKPGQGVMVNRNLKTAANEAAEELPDMHPRGGKGATKRISTALPLRKKTQAASVPTPASKGSSKPMSNAEKLKKLSGMKLRLGQEAVEATAAEFQKELGTSKSILTGKDSSPRAAKPAHQVPANLLRRKGAEPAPAPKPSGIKAKLRAAFTRKKTEGRIGFPSWDIVESSSINFECDCDDSGGPAIDWERLTKSYEKRNKGKR